MSITVPEALRNFAAAASALADAMTAERAAALDAEVVRVRKEQGRPIPVTVAVAQRPIVDVFDREGLTKTEVKILTALAQVHESSSRALSAAQIGIRTGLSHTSGSFTQTLADLRKEELIVGKSGGIRITADGLEALGPFPRLPEGEALFEYWCHKVGGAGSKILKALRKRCRDVGASTVASAGMLGADTGLSATSGSFTQALADLRKLELIEGGGSGMTLSVEMQRACEVTIGVHDTSTGKSVRVDRGGRVAK